MARPPAVEANTAYRVTLNLQSVGLTDDQFNRLCSDNRDSRIELTADKQLIIMSPCGPETSWRNAKIIQRLGNWADVDNTGLLFGPDAIFSLPNGAKRSPDASWIAKRRWNRLTEAERLAITPICPDFVLELRSISDRVADLEEKMEEYVANGAKLGWLLDYIDNRAVIYRPGQQPLPIHKPEIIVGDPILKGFHFDFREILL
jgi:Uma2 family endonuclease